MDTDNWVLLLIVVGGLGFIIGSVVLVTNTYALAAEEAQNYCVTNGYDTYDTFQTKVLSGHALGVKCNYIANRREVITNGQAVVVAQG